MADPYPEEWSPELRAKYKAIRELLDGQQIGEVIWLLMTIVSETIDQTPQRDQLWDHIIRGASCKRAGVWPSEPSETQH